MADGGAPGISEVSLKPKRSAAATRRLAPSSAPSGANTLLQDSAKADSSDPPQASPLAFSSETPDRVVSVCTG